MLIFEINKKCWLCASQRLAYRFILLKAVSGLIRFRSPGLIMDDVDVEKIVVNSVEDNKKRNESLTTELHFELLKQYAWLSSAIIGAITILIQLMVVVLGNKFMSH